MQSNQVASSSSLVIFVLLSLLPASELLSLLRNRVLRHSRSYFPALLLLLDLPLLQNLGEGDEMLREDPGERNESGRSEGEKRRKSSDSEKKKGLRSEERRELTSVSSPSRAQVQSPPRPQPPPSALQPLDVLALPSRGGRKRTSCVDRT